MDTPKQEPSMVYDFGQKRYVRDVLYRVSDGEKKDRLRVCDPKSLVPCENVQINYRIEMNNRGC